MTALAQLWQRFWFRPASPANLGVCRVWFFAAAFVYYCTEDFSAWAQVSSVFWDPIVVFRFLNLPLASSAILIVLQTVWKIALALSCVGLATRVSTVTAFVLGGYLIGLPHNFGKIHHYDALLLIVLGIMAVARCGDAWSLDRWLWSKRDDVVPSGEYWWPVRLVWLTMSLVFFASGVAKLRTSGLAWVFSDNLAITLVQNQYHRAHSDPLVSWGLALAQHARWCQTLAAITVLSELSAPLAVVSGWARAVVVPVLFAIQVGIRVVLGPSFDQLMICYIFWVPWNRLLRGGAPNH
jgi:hypothetical protein